VGVFLTRELSGYMSAQAMLDLLRPHFGLSCCQYFKHF